MDKIKIAVCASLVDPFFTEGRSRLLWAANHVSAYSDLGYKSYLIANATRTPIGNNLRKDWILNEIKNYYDVDGDFKILPIYDMHDNKNESDKINYNFILKRYILNNIQLLHTRDPQLAIAALDSGVKVIYEDHDELMQSSMRVEMLKIISNPYLLNYICISEGIKYEINQIKESTKIIVIPSGVKNHIKPINNIITPKKNKNIIYAGGIQDERDINLIIKTSNLFKNHQFIIIGGRGKQLEELNSKIKINRSMNVNLIGYLRSKDMRKYIEYYGDILIYTRTAGHTESNTSPLKFYEYLNYNKPIVSAKLKELELQFLNYPEMIDFYLPGDEESFICAIKSAIDKKSILSDHQQLAQSIVEDKSWKERSKKILNIN